MNALTRSDSTPMIDALREVLSGEVIVPGHPAYEEARQVWNGLIDRHPAVIARCTNVEDVQQAVAIARRYRPPVSIRGGGHQVAGSAVCNDGLVIDLSRMNTVEVDPERQRAQVGGGATWGDVDPATQRHGLAVTGGEVSTTGVGGFTLGGGMGVTMRAHGLACDNLRSIEIVTADGERRRAAADEHPDLFWAARGGGRGIGVVTSFEFDLHPLGREVANATVLYPFDQAEGVLRAFREIAPMMPETVTPQLMFWSVPPDPVIPSELHGQPAAIAIGLYAGPAEESSGALAPLAELGTPMFDASGTVDYAEQQASVDEFFPHGGRYFMKSHGMDELNDDVVQALIESYRRRPTPDTLIAIRTLGGAVARVGSDESAFPHRGDRFNVSIDAGWSDPALDDEAVAWARDLWDALEPHANGGVYVNFAGLEDDGASVRDRTFRSSQRRLAEVRAAYDPEGLFAGAARRP
jgi:FAD/FMN-containing dehydrogenase